MTEDTMLSAEDLGLLKRGVGVSIRAEDEPKWRKLIAIAEAATAPAQGERDHVGEANGMIPADHSGEADEKVTPPPSTELREAWSRRMGSGRTCIACAEPFRVGQRFLPDVSGGLIHRDCCGPERECFVNADGDPLEPDEPIPEGETWSAL